jgi:hypothetical protein
MNASIAILVITATSARIAKIALIVPFVLNVRGARIVLAALAWEKRNFIFSTKNIRVKNTLNV